MSEPNQLTEWAEEDGIQLRFTKIPCDTQPVECLKVEVLDHSGCEQGKTGVCCIATFVHFRAKRIADFIGSLERR